MFFLVIFSFILNQLRNINSIRRNQTQFTHLLEKNIALNSHPYKYKGVISPIQGFYDDEIGMKISSTVYVTAIIIITTIIVILYFIFSAKNNRRRKGETSAESALYASLNTL